MDNYFGNTSTNKGMARVIPDCGEGLCIATCHSACQDSCTNDCTVSCDAFCLNSCFFICREEGFLD